MAKKPTYEELEQRVKGLEQDILKLKRSEERFRIIFNNAPQGIVLADHSGRFLKVNLAWENMFGYNQEESQQLTIQDITFPEDIKISTEKLADLFNGDIGLYRFEKRFKRKDGSIFWGDLSVSLIHDLENDLEIALGVVVDVTDRKRFEEALRESKGKLNAMLQSIGDHISMMDKDLNIVWANETAKEMFGNDIIGKKCYEVYHQRKEPCEPYPCITLKAFQDGEVHKHDTQVIDQYGKKIFFHCTANVSLRDKEGKPTAVLEISRDITKQKSAEEFLARAEHEKKSILDSLLEHVVYTDLEMRILWANTAACKSINLTRDEVIGRYCFELWTDGSEPCSDCAVVTAIKTGQVQEIEKTTPDRRSWLNIACPVRDDKNTIIGGIEVTLEITELKKTEELLRESEERYRSLAENSLVGFWQTTLDGYTIYINPAMCQMLEIEDPEELNGKTYDSFCDDENLEIIKCELAKREKGMSSTYEVELIGRKGTKRNVMISGAPIFLSEDKVHSTIGTLTDITDRKKAEKALIKAHNELEQRVKQRTRELETKKKSLEEINTAMKILLKKREEDKTEIESNVLTNIKELIEPYVEKIKKTKLDDQQRALLSIMGSNINEIVSPFTRKMSLKYLNLTPTEIKIANLIRYGSNTKKIAEIMNVSPRTVETHRKNIRRKIGLDGRRANLRSHLLSLH